MSQYQHMTTSRRYSGNMDGSIIESNKPIINVALQKLLTQGFSKQDVIVRKTM